MSYVSLFIGALFIFSFSRRAHAGAGTDGANFLNIPVGGGPAAMGGAYSALAEDAYATTWNPAGLGFLESTQFSGQHLDYLDTLHYEHMSFAVPLPHSKSAVGGSIQYLGSGNVDGTDETGLPTGEFSSHYASYNLSYGRSLNDKLSLGLTSKMISAKIAEASATAFAADLGSIYKLREKLALAATLTNLGTKLKFVDEGDSLPMAFHLGAAFEPSSHWIVSAEGVYRQTGLASMHLGGEWRPIGLLSLRAGYRTDTLKELSPLAGVSTGMGINLWGHELAYAWVPYSDLGNTHYISLLMRFGEAAQAKYNVIQHHKRVAPAQVKAPQKRLGITDFEEQLFGMVELSQRDPSNDKLLKEMIIAHEKMLKEELRAARNQDEQAPSEFVVPSPEENALPVLIPSEDKLSVGADDKPNDSSGGILK